MPGEDIRSLNLELKILEAYTRDVGRGVARLDYDSMDSLGASTGEVIELKGGKKTEVVGDLSPNVYLCILLMRDIGVSRTIH